MAWTLVVLPPRLRSIVCSSHPSSATAATVVRGGGAIDELNFHLIMDDGMTAIRRQLAAFNQKLKRLWIVVDGPVFSPKFDSAFLSHVWKALPD